MAVWRQNFKIKEGSLREIFAEGAFLTFFVNLGKSLKLLPHPALVV